MFSQIMWVKAFEEEDMVKKKRNEKVFCASDANGINLSTNDINDDVKGFNGAAVKKGIINEAKAVFQNNCKTRKFEETTLFMVRNKMKWGSLFEKPKRKKKEKTRRRKYFFFICI